MDISITLALQNKMTLEQVVTLHEKARLAGFADTDDFVTHLVKSSLEAPKTTTSRKKKEGTR